MVTMQISLGFHFRIETRMEDYARFFLPYRILFTSNVVGNWKIEAFLIDIEDIERNLQPILFGFCEMESCARNFKTKLDKKRLYIKEKARKLKFARDDH